MSFQEQVRFTCELCNQSHDKNNVAMVHSWKSVDALAFVAQKGIEKDGIICLPCRADIRRVLRDPSHKPRWEKKEMTIQCCIENCMNDVFANSHMADPESIKTIINECGLNCASVPVPTPLCQQHYHEVYKLLQPQQRNCPTCETSLKHVHSRPCPNPEVIQKHLRNTAGFEGSIAAGDKVCFSCYKSHLAILQQDDRVSTDSDLQSLLCNTRLKISNTMATTLEQVNDLAFDKVLLYVGEELLQGGALLLPDVYERFTTYRNELLKNTHFNEERKITAMWVLSNLSSTLQHHIQFSCKVKKYGTLLYRPNSDLKGLLQHMLWRLRSKENDAASKQPLATPDLDMNKKETFLACKRLNSLVLEQCKLFRTNYSTFADSYDKLDIQAIVSQINPELWESICLLTKSISDNRKSTQESVAASSKHLKMVRRFFLLCMVLYCTDDRCSLPMHTMIADVIDSQGGSEYLIKILDRKSVV